MGSKQQNLQSFSKVKSITHTILKIAERKLVQCSNDWMIMRLWLWSASRAAPRHREAQSAYTFEDLSYFSYFIILKSQTIYLTRLKLTNQTGAVLQWLNDHEALALIIITSRTKTQGGSRCIHFWRFKLFFIFLYFQITDHITKLKLLNNNWKKVTEWSWGPGFDQRPQPHQDTGRFKVNTLLKI